MTESYLNKLNHIVILIILSAGTILPIKSNAQANEYLLKAGYIEKITHFIEWPKKQNKNDSIFIIDVYGDDKFYYALGEIFNKVNVKNKKVKIRTITNIEELSESQLLFIPKIKTNDLSKVLNYVKGKPILTISDSEGFAEAGGFINFYEFENKLRFEINQRSMEEAGFTVDYRLLRIAKVLNPVAK